MMSRHLSRRTRIAVALAILVVGTVGFSVLAAPGAVDNTAEVSERAVRGPASSEGSRFSEDFSGNGGLDRFRTGIYHRDENLVAETSWQGDHDQSCGAPTTSRTIRRDDPDASFYVCRDHLMTAVGDTAGYSTAFFTPTKSFADISSVSWSVNVTDLGGRQWWEVAVLAADDPDLVAIDWLSPDPSGLPSYPADAVVMGNGPFGGDLRLTAGGETINPTGFRSMCGSSGLDPEGCASKMVRRPFTLTDNGNGTVSLEMFGETYTVAGSFPDGDLKVVFKDHNYTPDKDGVPIGHTWHWDDIAIS